MLIDDGLSSVYLLFCLRHLRQGRETVKVFGNVRIVNGTIVLRHFQGTMSQQLLEHERIPATIHQILAGECMAVQMGACFLHATGLVMPSHSKPQAVH